MKDKHSSFLAHGEDDQHHVHSDHNFSNTDYSEHDHSHKSGFGHSHSHDFRDVNGILLFWCLVITSSFSLIEWVGGYITRSIALQTDAVHMFTDAIGLLIAYIANIISKRSATINLTFGFGKAEAVGALINCTFTIILTLGLLIEAVIRFIHPTTVSGGGVFILATLGLVVNGGIAFALSKNLVSLNTRTAFIHAIGDLLGSLVAIIAGLVIYFTKFSLVDPILSVFLIIFMIVSNYNIIKKSCIVLMAGVPEHLDYVQIGKDLEDIPEIASVHDLHIWYMSANNAALSAHIVAKNPLAWQDTLIKCQKLLQQKYKIEHVTLQHEFDDVNHTHCKTH